MPTYGEKISQIQIGGLQTLWWFDMEWPACYLADKYELKMMSIAI